MTHQSNTSNVTRKQAFSTIYDRHDWPGESRSGSGSDPGRTIEYRSLLQAFLSEQNIRSVVDLGCGDWSVGRLIDWTGIDYVGIDVVESVIAANRDRFGGVNRSFLCMDAVQDELPRAELLIVKDVLQHLPIGDVKVILEKTRAFRFAILVNDIAHERGGTWRELWRWRSPCPRNTEVEAGGYRLLALREPPFSLDATSLLTYANRYENLRWTKEVLLIRGDGN